MCLPISATVKSQKLFTKSAVRQSEQVLLREYASFLNKMPEVDCLPTGEDLRDPSSVHKRNESIIKLPLITDGYFTAGARLPQCSSGLVLFQHGGQSLLVIWQYLQLEKCLFCGRHYISCISEIYEILYKFD